MGIFFWQGNEVIDEFAIALAEEFYRKLSPEKLDSLGSTRKKKLALESEIKNVLNKLKHFKSNHKLGIYKKARIQNVFNIHMAKKGYSNEIIKLFKELMLTRV